MALTLLIFSACMPFMVLTYLLRGIDLPTISSCLPSVSWSARWPTPLGIFAGSVSGSWLIRGLAAGGVSSSSVYLGGGVIAIARRDARSRHGNRRGRRRQFWGPVGTVALLAVLAIGLLYVLSVALLSPKLVQPDACAAALPHRELALQRAASRPSGVGIEQSLADRELDDRQRNRLDDHRRGGDGRARHVDDSRPPQHSPQSALASLSPFCFTRARPAE